MIHLPLKDKLALPARLEEPGALRQIKRAVDQADGGIYTASYYPAPQITALLRAYSIHKAVLSPGDTPKCNYCESYAEKVTTLQVEHFRPKAKVDEADNNGVALPGYYWLGLEWTNLLLTCPKCNGKSAKGNRFPIRGVRAVPIQPITVLLKKLKLDRTGCYADENPLLAEEPILLNPEIDHPEDYLTFDNLGNIFGHGDDAERGEVSKDIYQLNRDALLAARADIWNDFKNEVLLDIGGHTMGDLNDAGLRFSFKKTCRKMIKRKLPSEEYTLWGRYINDHIEDFIEEVIVDDAYRDRFREAYQEVLAEQQQAPVAVNA
ncbi:hypothetical protein ACCC92_03260 [Mucilaginibacter sp. Mucisp84]|uniref:hypothetical protein n=1 Tax=Mucilaginibacter sp. Mucisp84 TaxID=3243058 RepID=UPI0039A7209A